MYSTTGCPSCIVAKALLDKGKVKYKVKEINTILEGNVDIQSALEILTGKRTVPSIFIHGKHIGGWSELRDLHQRGEL